MELKVPTISTYLILGSLFAAPAAHADVTAAQVWEQWKTLGESYGQTISGTETVSGDTLTVSDVEFAMEMPEGNITGKLPEMAFTELGNGTVAVTMSPEYPIKMDMKPAKGEAVALDMLFRQTDMVMIVSGQDNETSYDFKIPQMSVSVDNMVVDGTPVDFGMDISMSDIAGLSQMVEGDKLSMESKMDASALNLALKVNDPKAETDMDFKMNMADLKSSGTYVYPKNSDVGDFAAMLKDGFTANGEYSFAAMSYDMTADEKGNKMNIVASGTDGNIQFNMGDSSLTYGGTQNGLKWAISGSQIPFPELTAEMAEAAFKLTMPIAQTDDATDFALLTSMKGLSISEQIWGMFDPAAVLPRDPATLVVDLTGKAKWLFDIFDPEAANNPALAENPGELHALTVNDLQLSLAGAELTGAGDFTFDNADKQTFDGMPKPTGSLGLKLVGGNGLMDKLVQMGLLPEEQAMGARMMMGLFARPGDGEDTLVSDIEVTEDGQVLANGQRLR